MHDADCLEFGALTEEELRFLNPPDADCSALVFLFFSLPMIQVNLKMYKIFIHSKKNKIIVIIPMDPNYAIYFFVMKNFFFFIIQRNVWKNAHYK